MTFEEWWNRYSYDWRPDIAAEHKPTAEHAYTAGVQAERERCARIAKSYDYYGTNITATIRGQG